MGLEEQMAAAQAAMMAEKEAEQAAKAKLEAKKTTPKGKPKPKAAVKAQRECQEMPLLEAEELVATGEQQLMRRDEAVVANSFPWFSVFCCKHSEVAADVPSFREHDDAPVQVF